MSGRPVPRPLSSFHPPFISSLVLLPTGIIGGFTVLSFPRALSGSFLLRTVHNPNPPIHKKNNNTSSSIWPLYKSSCLTAFIWSKRYLSNFTVSIDSWMVECDREVLCWEKYVRVRVVDCPPSKWSLMNQRVNYIITGACCWDSSHNPGAATAPR